LLDVPTDIANVAVVDFDGLHGFFRPLCALLMYHNLLDEQPQQLWRQLRNVRVPLALAMKPSVLETVSPNFRMAASFAGISSASLSCFSI
jgi:hypothetical protein